VIGEQGHPSALSEFGSADTLFLGQDPLRVYLVKELFPCSTTARSRNNLGVMLGVEGVATGAPVDRAKV
jgi:hypothetical protein